MSTGATVSLRNNRDFGILFLRFWKPQVFEFLLGKLDNSLCSVHKGPFIILGTCPAIWPKSNFGLTGHHDSWRSPLPRVCAVPSASAIFKLILEIVFGESVQYRLWFCLDYLNSVKMTAFQFYFQWGKQKSMMGEWRQLCCFWSKIPWCERKCETVRCREATASSSVSKARGKVFAHFHVVAVKRNSSMWIWLLDLPERILCEQSSWCHRRMMSMLLTLPFICPEPSMPFKHLCTSHAFFHERSFNNCQGLRRTFS
jgi:hypothetical protein